MRLTKVIAFSVPPEFVDHIRKNAKKEHRTVSEYIRESIRFYIESKGGKISKLKAAGAGRAAEAVEKKPKKKLLGRKKAA
jgi:Arc/MetJ-type ribon-helix-helix transcriptional regulator